MFIIDFRNKVVSEYRFSVVNNSNCDLVHFYSHFTQYANKSIYLKIRSAGNTYIDKIAIDSENVSIEDDALVIKWLINAVSTQCKQIELQLQFEDENENLIAQSRIVKLILADTIDVSHEIEPIYPDILRHLQEQIDTLKAESYALSSISYTSDTLTILMKNKNEQTLTSLQVSIPTSDKYTKEEVNTIVAGLVAKVSAQNKIYGTDNSGAQTTYSVDEGSGYGGNVARRDVNGQLHLPLVPTANDHAVAKSYVDGLIDEIEQRSDVVDVVGTYADLEAYDTSHLSPNSLIKVINDETHDNEITYYRWVITDNVGAWVYVASEGAYYTTSQIDIMLAYYSQLAGNNQFTGNNEFTKSVKAPNTLNVINASDIVSNTLTEEQYALLTNGKPTLVIGQLQNTSNLLLLPAILSGANWNGTCLYNTAYPVQVIGLYTIHSSTKLISISTTGKQFRFPNVDQINGKTIPTYPTSNEFEALFGMDANGGNLKYTMDYFTLFNPNESSANNEIKWSKMLSFNKSADTTFTFETAKTNCLCEYKALLTNSGSSTITITLPSGVKIVSNDDNIVISNNTFTLPSGVNVELNCLNNSCVVFNFSAE